MPVPLTIKDMHKFARDRGGECLSEIYVNQNIKLSWMCSEGHTWEATRDSLKKKKNWCRACSGKTLLTIEEMQKFAVERGGKCLSEKYIQMKTNLSWMCSEGHTWEATPDKIIYSKSWCPTCAENLSLTIEEMHKIAEDRGGKCLSDKYINLGTKLSWMCSEGHTWEATSRQIKHNKSWCNQCNWFYSEEICRTIFEQIFDKKFIKIRPVWLTAPTGRKLELDGYCEELKIAFEYNGEQHYKENVFAKTKSTLAEIKYRDELKQKLCEEYGVHLFIITYKNVLSDLPTLIKAKMDSIGLVIHGADFTKNIDFNRVYQSTYRLLEMQKIAEGKDGICLSTNFTNNDTKLSWMCSEGHIWEATPNKVKNTPTWCPICEGRTTLTIEEMHKTAEDRGGKCLSVIYVNTSTKLSWMCSEGHTWEATPTSIKHGKTWCAICAGGTPLTIEEMQKIAEDRGGKCLSEIYANSSTKLSWMCSERHTWEATPNKVKNQLTWCPICVGKTPLTIEEMRKIAEDRGGKCLSEIYVNTSTKLSWMCSEGHTWEATSSTVKNKKGWCPICSQTLLTIEEMHKIAEEKGGRCLSQKYINSYTKLSWMCSEGHTWEATPGNVKRNRWCPICSRKPNKNNVL